MIYIQILLTQNSSVRLDASGVMLIVMGIYFLMLHKKCDSNRAFIVDIKSVTAYLTVLGKLVNDNSIHCFI